MLLVKGEEWIVVDFLSFNIVKEMYVGYFWFIIIGDCLVWVLEFWGYDVLCFNYVGDWGI